MGYSYQGNKLCCDECGHAGARKYPCPFGYCPAAALCKECKSKPEVARTGKDDHRKMGCEEGHLLWSIHEYERDFLKRCGCPVRCSARSLAGNPNRVHVLFEDNQRTIGRYMSAKLYRAIPLGTNATVEDYERIGNCTLPIAPDDFFVEVAA